MPFLQLEQLNITFIPAMLHTYVVQAFMVGFAELLEGFSFGEIEGGDKELHV